MIGHRFAAIDASPPTSLRANAKGVAAIEFGFLAPFLALLLIGLIDLSRAFSAQFGLQAALSRTMELAQIGDSNGDYSYLSAEAMAAANVPAANVVLTKWTECGTSTAQLAFTATCTSGQQRSRFVRVNITKNFTPSFGAQIFPGAVNGAVPLTVSQVLRIQ